MLDICYRCLTRSKPIMSAPGICPTCFTKTMVDSKDWLPLALKEARKEYERALLAAAPDDTRFFWEFRVRGLRAAFGAVWRYQSRCTYLRLLSALQA